jgi:DNA-binding CsgD family transcriptional regulator
MREAGVRQQQVDPAGSCDSSSPAATVREFGSALLVSEFDLIRRIYAAASGELRWREFMDALSGVLDGAVVLMSLNDPNKLYIEELLVSGGDVEPARRQGDTLLASIAGSDESRRGARSGFVSVAAESNAPNLVHLTATGRGGADAAIIALRAPGEDDFSSEERALIGRLAPHLDRSYEALRCVLEISQQNLALAEVMDRLPAGILLLDEGAKVVFKNRSAKRMLERCDGFEIFDGALTAADRDSNVNLERLIDEVVDTDAAPDPGGVLVVRRPSGEAAYPVSVSRLLPGEALRDVVACVLVSDPDRGVEPAVELVRSLHGLTRAESELVGELARGRTLEEASLNRGVSINTMRSHLKRAFRKTGTSRQGELVQLVLRSFVPMAEE